MLSTAAFVQMGKWHVLKLRWQLRCLQWITRSVTLVFSTFKMALQCACTFQQIAGSQLPHPSYGQPGRVTAFSSANSHQQATDSSLPHCALHSPYLTTSLLSLSLFPSSQFSLCFAIHFSCCLYCILTYSSSLSSPNQLQLIWRYLTNHHCIFKNEDAFFDPFQSATKYCCLHQSQVFTLNCIHTPLNTA